MNDLSNEIRDAINVKFGTVSNFCRYIGVPQSTISTALKNGIGSMSFDTVIKILSALDIVYRDDVFVLPDEEVGRVADGLSLLDGQGRDKLVEYVEKERRVPAGND